MRFREILIIVVLFIPPSAFCGEKRELVLELLDVMHAKENHTAVLQSYETQFSNNPVTNTPDFRNYFREAMSWDGLFEPTVEIYEKTYTEVELQGLINFYKGPIGAAFIKKMPDVNKQCSELMMQRIEKAMNHLQPKSEL